MSLMIDTKRLILREIRPDDLVPVFNMLQHDDAKSGIMFSADTQADVGKKIAYSQKQVPAAVKDVIFLYHIILVKGQSSPIGLVGVETVETEFGRQRLLRFFVNPEHRGNGYGEETVRAFLHCGFTRLKFKSVSAIVTPENVIGIRVLEKCGFVWQELEPTKNREPTDKLLFKARFEDLLEAYIQYER